MGAHRPSHYDVLGVGSRASSTEIRAAYRDLARRLHPDRAVRSADAESGGGRTMSAVNEAYRVLSDPARRAVYDRSLSSPPASGDDGSQPGLSVDAQPDRSRRTVLSPAGPARVPWKLMVVLALLGSGAVLASSAFDGPAEERVPDGILEIGSCIEFEANGDVREVACSGTAADEVVEVMVPLSDTCPVGSSAHRDRLGMVKVCIRE